MSNIELSIPVSVTAAQIRWANRSIDEEAAQKDAAALHEIVACVQRAIADAQPYPTFEVSDLIGSRLRTVVDIHPSSEDEAASEVFWVAGLLMHAEQLTGVADLYRNYLRICGHVDGTDYDIYFDDDDDDDDDAYDLDAAYDALMAGTEPK